MAAYSSVPFQPMRAIGRNHGSPSHRRNGRPRDISAVVVSNPVRNVDSLTRRETIYVTYVALSLVSVAGFVLATVWLLVSAGQS